MKKIAHINTKRTIIAVLALITVVAVNLCCYLFWGQYDTVRKIEQGKQVNAYEKFSILTMHSCLYTIGWLYSSDAALANMYMLSSHEDNKVFWHSEKWLSPKIRKRFAENRLGRMAWNGNEAYAYGSPERDAAILLNWCILSKEKVKGKMCYVAKCDYTWKVPSRTEFRLCNWLPPIVIHEQLFYELEKEWILKPYQLVCYYEINE